MVKFVCKIEKFGSQGEKTGWTYILIPAAVANEIKPDCRQSFRVKGSFDETRIDGMAMLPMGGGDFIIPLKADLRKQLGKQQGAKLTVAVEEDRRPVKLDKEFIDCLQDEPAALEFFNSLAAGHRNYFSKWIESAKTPVTKAKRISMAVTALHRKWGYSEMIRAAKSSI